MRVNAIGARPDLRLLLALLRDLHADPLANLAERAERLETSPATIKRALAQAEEALDVRVSHDRRRGYRIEDWGLLNRSRVLAVKARG